MSFSSFLIFFSSCCSDGDRGLYFSRSCGEIELRCRSSGMPLMPLLLFDSSGRCRSCLLSIDSGCWAPGRPSGAPLLPPAPRAPAEIGCGIPIGIGGAPPPCEAGTCWARICCSKCGRSGRCCYNIFDFNYKITNEFRRWSTHSNDGIQFGHCDLFCALYGCGNLLLMFGLQKWNYLRDYSIKAFRNFRLKKRAINPT